MTQTAHDSHLVYVACCCGGDGDGLGVFLFDRTSGVLSPLGTIGIGVHNPLYVDADPQGRFLFVADDVKECDGTPGGAVAAYRIDTGSGELAFLNRQSAAGRVPRYVHAGSSGRFVLVANYGDGSVLPVQEDGRVGKAVASVKHQGSSVHPDRQQGPHTHSFRLDPAGQFGMAADLGLDKILS